MLELVPVHQSRLAAHAVDTVMMPLAALQRITSSRPHPSNITLLLTLTGIIAAALCCCRRLAEQQAGRPLFTGTFGSLKPGQRSRPLTSLLDVQVSSIPSGDGHCLIITLAVATCTAFMLQQLCR